MKGGNRIFLYAYRGIKMVLQTEKNARIHIIITALVIVAGLFFGISRYEWFVVILAAGFVTVSEVFNTAIERIVDLVSPQYSEKAGNIKDIAAGAVLIAAITAVAVGILVFLPYIVKALSTGGR